MKAVEMRAKAIQPMYEAILANHEKATSDGKTFGTGYKYIYPEVVEMLLDDGFDIERVFDPEGNPVRFSVSCCNAEEGRRGVITDKPLIPSEIGDVIGSILGGCCCDDDDDEDDEGDDK